MRGKGGGTIFAFGRLSKQAYRLNLYFIIQLHKISTK
jgi:hypothetical protein